MVSSPHFTSSFAKDTLLLNSKFLFQLIITAVVPFHVAPLFEFRFNLRRKEANLVRTIQRVSEYGFRVNTVLYETVHIRVKSASTGV